MHLSIGIVGLPNVGKSTLFKILTAQNITIANYPFATIDPNVGVVPVPDERLEKLAKLSNSKKIIPAIVEFYDIAGLVKGSHKGEGLGNQFLSHIRETQAIVVVLRVFENPEIIHVENGVDPSRDMEIINSELILKDLETVEKAFAKIEGEARTGLPAGGKKAIQTKDDFIALKKWLEDGNLPVSSAEIMSIIRSNPKISELNLLTAKKQLYLLNGEESEIPAGLPEKIKEIGADYIVSNLAVADKSTIENLIKKAYKALNLISFLTTGEDETRAWTIEMGTKAPQAAGVIHTDFEKNFIRMEVINWQKLSEAGGWNQAKQKGFIKLEGKEYEVKDGDVVVVRHGA
jgi:hypothetical protein